LPEACAEDCRSDEGLDHGLSNSVIWALIEEIRECQASPQSLVSDVPRPGIVHPEAGSTDVPGWSW
jgi:hypothetical protein